MADQLKRISRIYRDTGKPNEALEATQKSYAIFDSEKMCISWEIVQMMIDPT